MSNLTQSREDAKIKREEEGKERTSLPLFFFFSLRLRGFA
jgi:hypothetical protein